MTTAPTLTVSEQAAVEIKRLVEDQGDQDLAVRIWVTGACGCGAARYGMALDSEVLEGEATIDTAGVRIVVDPDSAPYLEGATIDYRDSLMGRGFSIVNERAGGGCGCGHGG